MFLDLTLRRNRELIDYSFYLHQTGQILPDTYVIDMDAVVANGRYMNEEAKKNNLDLYIMTKQYGRNPIITSELMKIGFMGTVVVDYKEAKIMHDNRIPIGHIGHLVQIPSKYVDEVVAMKPEFITVYSLEKAREINEACKKQGKQQKIFLRVIDEGDMLYPAQYGGFYLDNLKEIVPQIKELSNLSIDGLTSFPCFLYDSGAEKVLPTNNIKTLQKGKRLLEDQFGIRITHLNMPSCTSTSVIPQIKEMGGTQGEPGHGLLGSTPFHAAVDLVERPAMVYVSEISHNLGDYSYCYGGGHYRRSHMENALVGKSLDTAVKVPVNMPDAESIDYYIELKKNLTIGDSVVMAFRTQVFVTRSSAAVVKGLSQGKPELIGIFNSQGIEIGR
jgi:predicted amino acid racemase